MGEEGSCLCRLRTYRHFRRYMSERKRPSKKTKNYYGRKKLKTCWKDGTDLYNHTTYSRTGTGRGHTQTHTHLDRADSPGRTPPGSLLAPCGWREEGKRSERGEMLASVEIVCMNAREHMLAMLRLMCSCNRCRACQHRQKQRLYSHDPLLQQPLQWVKRCFVENRQITNPTEHPRLLNMEPASQTSRAP